MRVLHLIDSSGWIEYFADTKYARHFARVIERSSTLLVPTITIYEVFKKILAEKSEDMALRLCAHMKLGKVVEIDMEIALLGGKLSVLHKLPMADSIILATARTYNATIWTLDADFKKFKGVRYFSKK